ncbi:carboxypeptidase-like regulatory domain-containing protein [Altibacter sp. HG106]|uniref:carboxypeptidase-like regulatory domain-containing protein n=1 Tax=Altibacter sp. HG106 TaxID=3023937 RepID=UPI002350DAA4|nr:carboxypeptidase-like regulatory domain-containing protein [Altibacter sp. HG106]MDC7996107.1 carboxypeptidase-like regulatory domain-containing protein [Altibacter sp. HG106]
MNPNHLSRFLLILFFVGASVAAQAQIELKSKVVDFLTYMPIENASVYVKNTTIGTISNADGNFSLTVPRTLENDTLIISSIGYKSFKTTVGAFEESMDIFLEEDIASLDEVLVVAETRPKTGNEIVLRAIEELPDNLPEEPYLQKGFLRHKERNKRQFKWLIESALTLYDSSYASGAEDNLKVNVDEIRKSYDLRDVDSLFSYSAYLKYRGNDLDLRSKKLDRDTIETASLVEAIRWNDRRINGLDRLFKGKLNLVRNANASRALLGKDVLKTHQFTLDTILVENDRKLYKIKISKSEDYIGLNTPGVYNEGFEAQGWMYIYWDNFAIKKVEYELIAASKAQRSRSKSLFDTLVNHKLVMTYREYNDKMYPSYIYYETPKLVKVGDRSSDQPKDERAVKNAREEQFYYTVQEILFTEIISDSTQVMKTRQQDWSADIFSSRPYNERFWKNYNVLLESEEEEKLIQDLTRRATLFKE